MTRVQDDDDDEKDDNNNSKKNMNEIGTINLPPPVSRRFPSARSYRAASSKCQG